MRHVPPANSAHFTAIVSAAEEVDVKLGHDAWDNEGGHMGADSGRVVRTPDARLPYKVILTHCGVDDSEHSAASVREAEAFIRRNTPAPAARSTLYDRSAAQAADRAF